MGFKKHDITVHIQALALVEEGISTKHVTEITSLSRKTIFNLKKKAYEYSYNPAQSHELKIEYLEDIHYSGCSKLVIDRKKKILLEYIQKNYNNRKKSSNKLS